MPVRVRVTIEPVLLFGLVSVGTVPVVKAVREHAGLGLAPAHKLVSRAVFGGEAIFVEVADLKGAEALIAALEACDHPGLTATIDTSTR